jgi:hypothetical protein
MVCRLNDKLRSAHIEIHNFTDGIFPGLSQRLSGPVEAIWNKAGGLGSRSQLESVW